MTKIGQLIREIITPLLLVGIIGVMAHDKLYPPTPPAPPDRVVSAAKAYLAIQPLSLLGVADQLRKGLIKAEGVADAIAAARGPAAEELAEALKADPDLATALEKAGNTLKQGLR